MEAVVGSAGTESPVAEVAALGCKALTLITKSQFTRAAEKFGAAAEAACNALGGGEHCLVAANARAFQVFCLFAHTYEPGVNAAERKALLQQVFHELLPPLMAVLESRRAAGTLLEGTCRPAEVAYSCALAVHAARMYGDSEQAAARKALLVGYETYLVAARASLGVWREAFSGAVLLSDAQLVAQARFAASAMDLVALPRRALPDTMFVGFETG